MAWNLSSSGNLEKPVSPMIVGRSDYHPSSGVSDVEFASAERICGVGFAGDSVKDLM